MKQKNGTFNYSRIIIISFIIGIFSLACIGYSSTALADITIYTQGQATTTFKFNGTGGGTTAIQTLEYLKVGDTVTLSLPAFATTTGTNSFYLTNNTMLPSIIRPSNQSSFLISTLENNGVSLNVAGWGIIYSDGSMYIQRDPNGTTFTNGGQGGLSTPQIITYHTNSTTGSSLIISTSTFKGDKGDKGDTGNTGATGATGPQGIQGATGTPGYITSSSTLLTEILALGFTIGSSTLATSTILAILDSSMATTSDAIINFGNNFIWICAIFIFIFGYIIMHKNLER